MVLEIVIQKKITFPLYARIIDDGHIDKSNLTNAN